MREDEKKDDGRELQDTRWGGYEEDRRSDERNLKKPPIRIL